MTAMIETRSAPDSGLKLERLTFGAPVEEVMAILRRDGGVILEDALSPEQVAQINADLDPHLWDYHTGALGGDAITKEFWGALTKRVTNVFLLSETYRTALVDNPQVHEYVDAVFKGVSESVWLNATQVIEIMPGEDEQPLHRDMGNYPVFYQFGAEGPEVTLNLLTALVDVDDACGATRVIPGSHAWPDFSLEATQDQTIPAEMRAGSILFYSGKLIHGGGANRTVDVRRRVVTTTFTPCFLVPEEAYPFSVPLEAVRRWSPRMQQMLGFRSFHQRDPLGGSLWQVNYEELSGNLGL
jgi:ectoine hydroxylase-related dioxygenase (phytanoyl-CoA dioxygenase family)